MQDLQPGFYWLKNYLDYENKFVYRPVEVIVVKDGYMHAGLWRSAGTFVMMIGSKVFTPISYFEETPWKQVEFIRLEEPKETKEK